MQYDSAMLERAMDEAVELASAALRSREGPAFLPISSVELLIDEMLRNATRHLRTVQRLPKKVAIVGVLRERFASNNIGFRAARNLRGFVNESGARAFADCKGKGPVLISERADCLRDAKMETPRPFVMSLPPA